MYGACMMAAGVSVHPSMIKTSRVDYVACLCPFSQRMNDQQVYLGAVFSLIHLYLKQLLHSEIRWIVRKHVCLKKPDMGNQ